MSSQLPPEEDRRKILRKFLIPSGATSIKVLPLHLLDKDVKAKIDASATRNEAEDMYWTTPSTEKEDSHYRVFLSPQGAKTRRRGAKALGVKFEQFVAGELYCSLICDNNTNAFFALCNFRFWYEKMGKVCWDYLQEKIRAKQFPVNEYAQQAFAELLHKFKSGELKMSDAEMSAFEKDLDWLGDQYRKES
ncbi:MAG: hypothetical protein F4Z57_15705 [Gemmatimonadetes bacterium]|nr:hypothetical protein [Gemmatimonadota bacterium]MYC70760.1 hypothetical protein [Gemmatimonadota bacterium]